MKSEFYLNCKGDPSNRNAHKVYFCCNASDFQSLFDAISDEVISIDNNINIYYYDPANGLPEQEDLYELLREMQLFIVPVTEGFLNVRRPSFARTHEFSYAIENHIPVIPLMQKPEAFSDETDAAKKKMVLDFNSLCGDIEYIDKDDDSRNPGLTYHEKLARTLNSILVNDDLYQKIREAFDAYIFLSYRKKDRADAKRVMQLIHDNEFCRDLAIWYDEFLVPGEQFNDAIEEAMKKSVLFALVVTPSLLENPNYVKDIEYPRAQDMEKKIVAVEARGTEPDELSRLYSDIGVHLVGNDPSEVHEKLHYLFKDIALRRNDDPVHNYFIGLAYLNGVDVETDKAKGTAIIQTAAEDSLPEAMEKLADIYSSGNGVERNNKEAVRWQRKYVDALKAAASSGEDYQKVYLGLDRLKRLMGMYSDLGSILEEMLDYAEKMREVGAEGWVRCLQDAYCSMGYYRARYGETVKARNYGEQALQLQLQFPENNEEDLLYTHRSIYEKVLSIAEKIRSRSWEIEIQRAMLKEMEETLSGYDHILYYRKYLNECICLYHNLQESGFSEEAGALSEKIEEYANKAIAPCESADDYQVAVKICDKIGHMYSPMGHDDPDALAFGITRHEWDDDHKALLWFKKGKDICRMFAKKRNSAWWCYKAFCFYSLMYSRDTDADVTEELKYRDAMLEMIRKMEANAVSRIDFKNLEHACSSILTLPDYLCLDERPIYELILNTRKVLFENFDGKLEDDEELTEF